MQQVNYLLRRTGSITLPVYQEVALGGSGLGVIAVCYESLFEKKDSSFFPGGPQKTFVQWNFLKFPNIGFFSHVALTLICIRKHSP